MEAGVARWFSARPAGSRRARNGPRESRSRGKDPTAARRERPTPVTERMPLAELSRPLLDHLRVALSAPGLCYAEPPTPITGGYDTQIFGFRLAGAAAPLSIPLILRVLAPHHPPARALCERAIQNAVADLGYPAPRVLIASVDAAILGGPFLVM